MLCIIIMCVLQLTETINCIYKQVWLVFLITIHWYIVHLWNIGQSKKVASLIVDFKQLTQRIKFCQNQSKTDQVMVIIKYTRCPLKKINPLNNLEKVNQTSMVYVCFCLIKFLGEFYLL